MWVAGCLVSLEESKAHGTVVSIKGVLTMVGRWWCDDLWPHRFGFLHTFHISLTRNGNSQQSRIFWNFFPPLRRTFFRFFLASWNCLLMGPFLIYSLIRSTVPFVQTTQLLRNHVGSDRPGTRTTRLFKGNLLNRRDQKSAQQYLWRRRLQRAKSNE